MMPMSGTPTISKMAFKKYQNEPAPIESGIEQSNNVYMNMISVIQEVNGIDIQNILDKYGATEEEFWKEAVIMDDINFG